MPQYEPPTQPPPGQPDPPYRTVAPPAGATPPQPPAAPVAPTVPAAVVVPVAPTPTPADPEVKPDERGQPELIIYSQSSLFYWWPVWVVGYILAAVTYWEGVSYQPAPNAPVAQQAPAEAPTRDLHRNLDGDAVVFHRSSNLGVLFFLTLFLTILITNVTVRGQASVIVILAIILGTVLLAYFNMWDEVLGWFGGLKIYLNMGAYFWFATLIFLVWLFTTFVFDRMSYWRIKPGQVTREFVLGASARSYDTENMVLEKYRDDFFRHWVLGFGSGDLHIKPYGSDREEIKVPSVLFIGTKISTIQHMIATEPAAFGHSVVK